MLLITAVISISLIGCSSAATVYVGSGAGNQSTTINGGINYAAPGDTVVVNPGTYTQNIALNKANINLTSSGTGTVTIRPTNTANPVITVSGTNTIINGFTITGATTSTGITVNSGMICTITNNIITDNRQGIYITGGTSQVNIANNTIYSNSREGIYINGNANTRVTVDANTIYNNGGATASGYPNILINNGVSTISNNKIYNTLGTGDDGIEIPGGTNTIFNNEIYGCEDGIDTEGGTNTIIANILRNNREDGIHVDSLGSGLTISFNAVYGNTQHGIHKVVSGTLTATNNWWGREPPTTGSANGTDIYNQGTGSINYDPWLVLTVTTSPDTINPGNSSTITVDFRYNSDGVIPTSPTGYRFPIVPVSFTTTDVPSLGDLNPTNSYTNSLTDPRSTSTFTGNTGGLAHITATVFGFSKQVTVKIISTALVVTNKLYSQLESITPRYGSEDYYYITVKNNGPDIAKNVAVSISMLPNYSAFNIIEWWVSRDNQVNYLRNDSSFNPANGVWTVGNIQSGERIYLDIRMIIRQTGAITNNATATADNANDTSKAFNINVPAPTGQNIDLQLTNSFSTPNPSTRRLTIVVTNLETQNRTASGVTVNNGLPAGINITSWRTRTGTGNWVNNDPLFDSWTGVWNIGNLSRGTGSAKTLEITFTLPSTSMEVLSTVYGNQNDPNLNNNIGTATLTVGESLLASQSTITQVTPLTTSAATTGEQLGTNNNLGASNTAIDTSDSGTTTEDQSGTNNNIGTTNSSPVTSNGGSTTTDTNSQDNGFTKLISDILVKLIESFKNTANSIFGALNGLLG